MSDDSSSIFPKRNYTFKFDRWVDERWRLLERRLP
jgi:hypothetical protein